MTFCSYWGLGYTDHRLYIMMDDSTLLLLQKNETTEIWSWYCYFVLMMSFRYSGLVVTK